MVIQDRAPECPPSLITTMVIQGRAPGHDGLTKKTLVFLIEGPYRNQKLLLSGCFCRLICHFLLNLLLCSWCFILSVYCHTIIPFLIDILIMD